MTSGKHGTINKVVLDLPIRSHGKTNFLEIAKLAKRKNQIIFVFSRFESAFRELTENHQSKIYFLPPIQFSGFSLGNIHLFTDADFEQKIKRRRFAKIVEFGVGDFVVHIDHGICKLEGIGPKSLPLSLDEQIIGVKERKDFYYHLRFRHNAFLYAHLSEKNRITKYIGSNPKLSALGGKEWQEAKVRATIEAKRLARKLAKLFLAIKQQKIELALQKIEPALKILDQTFGFSLTNSQQKAIDEVKNLIKKNKPFDHLIAGEASSGKTEIAIRVASMFLANSKQVLLLAPTTFLAYQNFLVAKNRLSNLRIKVGVLSRFNTSEENQKTIEAYNQRKIQLLVGTHKIFFSHLNLQKTGLLIIDEEQRFGVEQKEQLRIKKPNISMLSLSATPIPRTLNLALTGVKTMSVLSEMPFERGEVQNIILGQDNFKPIKKFIQVELKRDGQVYFVAPLIRDLYEIEQELINVGIKKTVLAHGRMNEKKLAQIFSDFSLGKIKVLLSTSIVEHGLDFPKANTMILWFGERLGMADLYQLRGRIGRSSRSSHFVLAIPQNISDSAYSRLIDFLSLIKESNAFYSLALKDLQTRGEGEIFGKRQHGVINKVGLYLFSDLVRKELKI
jgi:transcription-repair coupling factor (superfamily II helicase)